MAHLFPYLLLLVATSAFQRAKLPKNGRFIVKAVHSCRVALTREAGANEKLRRMLEGSVNCVELPCIDFGPGPDASRLSTEITRHDLVILSSPKAASIFINAWREEGCPAVKIATVGKGTSSNLVAEGLLPIFEPSDSTAETLAAELPTSLGLSVLYPTSSIAATTLESGLMQRGFKVTRLNTYETISAKWNDDALEKAKMVDIVTFASPSTVRSWSEKVGTDFCAITIGPTSARAAEKANFTQVVSPNGSKGLEAWAKLILSTAASL
jgi:uroporphyrinogen-III synthase